MRPGPLRRLWYAFGGSLPERHREWVLTAGACGLMFMIVHVIETTERRLVKAGSVGGTGELTRSARSHDSQRLANARRRARVAERNARRRVGSR